VFSAWNLHYIKDKELIVKVQTRFTKTIKLNDMNEIYMKTDQAYDV